MEPCLGCRDWGRCHGESPGPAVAGKVAVGWAQMSLPASEAVAQGLCLWKRAASGALRNRVVLGDAASVWAKSPELLQSDSGPCSQWAESITPAGRRRASVGGCSHAKWRSTKTATRVKNSTIPNRSRLTRVSWLISRLIEALKLGKRDNYAIWKRNSHEYI